MQAGFHFIDQDHRFGLVGCVRILGIFCQEMCAQRGKGRTCWFSWDRAAQLSHYLPKESREVLQSPSVFRGESVWIKVHDVVPYLPYGI